MWAEVEQYNYKTYIFLMSYFENELLLVFSSGFRFYEKQKLGNTYPIKTTQSYRKKAIPFSESLSKH